MYHDLLFAAGHGPKSQPMPPALAVKQKACIARISIHNRNPDQPAKGTIKSKIKIKTLPNIPA